MVNVLKISENDISKGLRDVLFPIWKKTKRWLRVKPKNISNKIAIDQQRRAVSAEQGYVRVKQMFVCRKLMSVMIKKNDKRDVIWVIVEQKGDNERTLKWLTKNCLSRLYRKKEWPQWTAGSNKKIISKW